jgi:hypothetical protein
MLFGIIEWWAGLPRGTRYVFSLAWLAFSTAIVLLADRIWIAGFVIGGVLLVCTFLGVGEDHE